MRRSASAVVHAREAATRRPTNIQLDRVCPLFAIIAREPRCVAAGSQCPSTLVEQGVVRLILAGDEIRPAIVGPISVDVMHALRSPQQPADCSLDDEDVFEDVSLRSCPRMVWHPNHEVPGVVLGPAALPIVVR